MIIAIDGYEANVSKRVGIGEYAYNVLIQIYARQEKAKSKHTFRVYVPSAPVSDMPQETKWWTYHVIPVRKFWTFVGLPAALFLNQPKAHVVFSPTHYVPRFVSIPRVMSIMDLSYLKYPELFRTKDLHQLVHWTAYSIKKVHAICTISQFTKDAIIRAYHAPEDRVTVTYPGLSMKKTKHSEIYADIKKKYGLGNSYILSVGTLQPRKNFVRLIEAFSLLRGRKEFEHMDLVIVGKKGWLYKDILDSPKKYGVAGQVKFLEFVSDTELSRLYEHADTFVLPSLYEGFGLPVLEAMAHETPVVVSRVSSLPEIAGDAGVYVDPENTQSIADGIRKAYQEKKQKKGIERVRIGKKRVKQFSWEKAARQTLKVLEKVGGE